MGQRSCLPQNAPFPHGPEKGPRRTSADGGALHGERPKLGETNPCPLRPKLKSVPSIDIIHINREFKSSQLQVRDKRGQAVSCNVLSSVRFHATCVFLAEPLQSSLEKCLPTHQPVSLLPLHPCRYFDQLHHGKLQQQCFH